MQKISGHISPQGDVLTFMKSNSGYCTSLTPYEALQCKDIAEIKKMSYEKVFDEMQQHKNTIEHRLYGQSLYVKFGLPEKNGITIARSFHQ